MKRYLFVLILVLPVAMLTACDSSTHESLVTACHLYSGPIALVDISTKQVQLIDLPTKVQDFAASPTAPVLAFITFTPREHAGNYEEQIGLYNIVDEQVEWLAIDQQEWPDGGVRYETIAWSPNGRYLYVHGTFAYYTNLQGPCTLYDCQERKSIITIPEVVDTYWSPEGDKLAVRVLTNIDELGDPEVDAMMVVRITKLNGESYELPLELKDNQSVVELFAWADNDHLVIRVRSRYDATPQTKRKKYRYEYQYIKANVLTGEWIEVEDENEYIPHLYPPAFVEQELLSVWRYDQTKSGNPQVTEGGYVAYEGRTDKGMSINVWNPKTNKEELILARATNPMWVKGLQRDWFK